MMKFCKTKLFEKIQVHYDKKTTLRALDPNNLPLVLMKQINHISHTHALYMFLKTPRHYNLSKQIHNVVLRCDFDHIHYVACYRLLYKHFRSMWLVILSFFISLMLVITALLLQNNLMVFFISGTIFILINIVIFINFDCIFYFNIKIFVFGNL